MRDGCCVSVPAALLGAVAIRASHTGLRGSPGVGLARVVCAVASCRCCSGGERTGCDVGVWVLAAGCDVVQADDWLPSTSARRPSAPAAVTATRASRVYVHTIVRWCSCLGGGGRAVVSRGLDGTGQQATSCSRSSATVRTATVWLACNHPCSPVTLRPSQHCVCRSAVVGTAWLAGDMVQWW